MSRTIYVAPTGNDTTGTGLAAAPFKTIDKALKAVTANDRGQLTIELADGTYPVASDNNTVYTLDSRPYDFSNIQFVRIQGAVDTTASAGATIKGCMRVVMPNIPVVFQKVKFMPATSAACGQFVLHIGQYGGAPVHLEDCYIYGGYANTPAADYAPAGLVAQQGTEVNIVSGRILRSRIAVYVKEADCRVNNLVIEDSCPTGYMAINGATVSLSTAAVENNNAGINKITRLNGATVVSDNMFVPENISWEEDIQRNRTIYLNARGSDTNGTGSKSNPFKTLDKALRFITTSDYGEVTIELDGTGVYYVQDDNAGMFSLDSRNYCLSGLSRLRIKGSVEVDERNGAQICGCMSVFSPETPIWFESVKFAPANSDACNNPIFSISQGSTATVTMENCYVYGRLMSAPVEDAPAGIHIYPGTNLNILSGAIVRSKTAVAVRNAECRVRDLAISYTCDTGYYSVYGSTIHLSQDAFDHNDASTDKIKRANGGTVICNNSFVYGDKSAGFFF